jgi:hypothetical protein
VLYVSLDIPPMILMMIKPCHICNNIFQWLNDGEFHVLDVWCPCAWITANVQLTQKRQVLRTDGKREGEQLDNKHEKAAVGEQARQVMLCTYLIASWRISQYKCSKGLTCKNDRMMYAGG